MKKLLSLFLVLAAAVSWVSCRSEEPEGTGSATEGVANIRIHMPAQTRSAEPWNDGCEIRLYKVTETLGKELVRHYFSLGDLPEELWLLAGDYALTADLGSHVAATFDSPSYFGQTEFRIEAGKSTDVTVQCDLLNTIVEVVFAESVQNRFDQGLRVSAMIGESYDEKKAAEGVNALTYEEIRRGYFLLADDETAFSFCFEGRSSQPSVGEFRKQFTKKIEAGKTAGYLYRLNFNWSPDADGHLDWDFSVTCDPSEDASEEYVPVNPAPRPVIEPDGWDPEIVPRIDGPLSFIVTSKSSELKTILIESEGQQFEVRPDSPEQDGIAVIPNEEDPYSATLVLDKAFFDHFAGGEHLLTLTAVTRNEGRGSMEATVFTPGAFSLFPTDKWQGEGTFKAYLFDLDAEAVKIRYRAVRTDEWTEAEAERDEEENVWRADASGISAHSGYEFQLLAGGETIGAIRTETTDDGPQIYNAGFEIWSMQGRVLCPYLDLNTDQWWDSGNHGSASMIGNITTNETDARPDSDGSVSARLASKSTLGILAAGNIYLGKFVGTKQTTKGVIRFGHAFDFTWRPKALQFWYKATVGKVDVLSSGTPDIQRGDQDQQQVYILLCDMPGPHIVDTSDPSTFLKLADGIEEISYYSGDPAAVTTSSKNDATGKVVAWGVWDNDASTDSWTLQTVELHYTRHADTRPCWLMITAAANKYGDYYSGCSSNVLYLDDVELVY